MKRLFFVTMMFAACATEVEQSELASSFDDSAGGLEYEPATPPAPVCADARCDTELEFQLDERLRTRPHFGFCGLADRCGADAACFKGVCIPVECDGNKDCGGNEVCYKQQCLQADSLTRPSFPR